MQLAHRRTLRDAQASSYLQRQDAAQILGRPSCLYANPHKLLYGIPQITTGAGAASQSHLPTYSIIAASVKLVALGCCIRRHSPPFPDLLPLWVPTPAAVLQRGWDVRQRRDLCGWCLVGNVQRHPILNTLGVASLAVPARGKSTAAANDDQQGRRCKH